MLVIGSDHGGFLLKQEIKKHLEENKIEYIDVGCYDESSVDYPDIAKAACDKIVSGECQLGILICGTGIGISMAANKVKGIRAACCSDCFSAKYTACTTTPTSCASAAEWSARPCLHDGGRILNASLRADPPEKGRQDQLFGGELRQIGQIRPHFSVNCRFCSPNAKI